MAVSTPGFDRVLNYAKDALTLAVIPVVGWLITLHTGNALRDERIQNLQAEIADLREQQKELELVKKDVQDAALHMVRLEGKLDAANGRLDEIRTLLR
jgi:Tfp pilus assembly protein PilN